jgi:hypothetical protein
MCKRMHYYQPIVKELLKGLHPLNMTEFDNSERDAPFGKYTHITFETDKFKITKTGTIELLS